MKKIPNKKSRSANKNLAPKKTQEIRQKSFSQGGSSKGSKEISNDSNDIIQFSARYLYPIIMAILILCVSQGWLLPYEWPLAVQYRWPLLLIFGGLAWLTYCNYRYYTKFRRVRLDEQFLYLSDYVKEVSVPRNEVKRVSVVWWLLRSSVLRIELAQDTLFGKEIFFSAGSSWFRNRQVEKTIIKELQDRHLP